MKEYLTPADLPPVNGYSHAVAFTGRMVAISGQVPMTAEGEIPTEPAAQIHQTSPPSARYETSSF